MRGMSRSETVVDLVKSVVDVGEIAKLAAKFGMVLEMETVEDKMGSHLQLTLTRSARVFLETEIAELVMLRSYVTGRAPKLVVDDVQRELLGRHAPWDRPIQDVMEIGGGPSHDGHDD